MHHRVVQSNFFDCTTQGGFRQIELDRSRPKFDRKPAKLDIRLLRLPNLASIRPNMTGAVAVRNSIGYGGDRKKGRTAHFSLHHQRKEGIVNADCTQSSQILPSGKNYL